MTFIRQKSPQTPPTSPVETGLRFVQCILNVRKFKICKSHLELFNCHLVAKLKLWQKWRKKER